MTGLNEENLIKRFLLGELSAEERERVEERLLSDEDFYAQVDAIEDELIDDFALGKLDAAERERFERQFLITDERRERLKFAWDFHQVLSDSHPAAAEGAAVNPAGDDYSGIWAWLRGRRALAFGGAFALLLMSAGAILLWQVLSRRNPQEQATARQEQRSPTSQNENVSTAVNGNQDKDIPKDQAPIETSQPRIASNTQTNQATRLAENRIGNRRLTVSSFVVALEPGSLRGEGDFKKFPVPKGMKTALLKLRFDDDEEGATRQRESYSVELQNGEIKTIHQAENLRSSSKRNLSRFVTLSVPARLLTAGKYSAMLRQRTPDGQGGGGGSANLF